MTSAEYQELQQQLDNLERMQEVSAQQMSIFRARLESIAIEDGSAQQLPLIHDKEPDTAS